MTETFPEDDLTKAQWDATREILARWERARQAQASARIEAAAGVNRECRFIADDQGGGEVAMRIDPYSYHYWGQRLGYQCWQDDQFCREYLRDNPAARVKSRPVNPTVGFASRVAAGIASVFSGSRRETETKTYG